MIPGPWEFALLALGAFRLSRLVGWDTITAGLRERVTGMTDEEAASWSELGPGAMEKFADAGELPDTSAHWHPVWRQYLSKLIRCPWCQGFYISALVYAGWVGLPRLTLAACALLGISSAVGLIAKNLDP